MVSNITFTDSSSNTVTIATTKAEELWVNEFQIVKVAKNVYNSSEGITTKLINLLRSIRSFNIDGYILANGDDTNGAFGGSDTVEQQRTKIRNMANSVRNVTMNYGSGVTSLSGGIQKLSITEVPTDEGTSPSQYQVKMLFVAGYNELTGEG